MTLVDLPVVIAPNDPGHIEAHEQVHGFVNAWKKSDDSGFWLPADVLTRPADHITYDNSLSGLASTSAQEAFDELAAKVGGWIPWTPVLHGTGGDPTLGTGSHVWGEYVALGQTVIAKFLIRWGTAAQVNGSGILTVGGLPVMPDLATTSAGATSIGGGHGLLYRGRNSGDFLSMGGHRQCEWHFYKDHEPQLIGVVPAEAPSMQPVIVSGTAADSIAAGAVREITANGDSSHLWSTIGANEQRCRFRITVRIPWFASVANTTMYVKLYDGSTLLRTSPCHAGAAGTGGLAPSNQQTAPLDYMLVNPSVGNHQIKASVYVDNASTIGYDTTNLSSAQLMIEEIVHTNGSNGNYIASDWPWVWSDNADGSEMWGLIIFKKA